LLYISAMSRVFFVIPALLLLVSCDEISPEYSDIPEVDYQGYDLRILTDQLGNKTLVGRITFEFTDGDGNVGLPPLVESEDDPNLPDTVKYNFFLHTFDLQGYEFVEVQESEGGFLKYRIPTLDKKPLRGTMELDVSYPLILHDTIFYTFYIFDRALNRSNTDTTDVIVLSGINLDEL
jgi:hypothetical protein